MIVLRQPATWVEQALCRSDRVDPEIFFPTDRRNRASVRAKALCRVCPVKNDCLAAALTTPDTRGIWGGLDEDERDALKARVRSA